MLTLDKVFGGYGKITILNGVSFEIGRGTITTEILPAGAFYNAEAYHQQYLHKNPGGYCNHGPNGFRLPDLEALGVVAPDVSWAPGVLGDQQQA